VGLIKGQLKWKHNRSLKVAVQGLNFMAHPIYIHTGIFESFPGNGFWQWRFFSFTPSGSVFTASHAELNPHLTNSQAGGHFTPTS
jgi:hypothetical protein